MYNRKTARVPNSIVCKGKANFGTFDNITKEIDIKGMKAPYGGIPLPSLISRLRIKSRLNYIFSTNQYIGYSEFFDFKLLGIARFILWNKENQKKCSYFSFMPMRRRFIPHKTSKASCTNFRKSKFMRVFWGSEHEHFALKFNFLGDNVRPSCKGTFFSSKDNQFHTDTLFVSPAPVSSRVSASWLSSMQIQGNITINNQNFQETSGLALMLLNRVYFKLHTKTTFLWALGQLNNQNLVLQLKISNMDAADSYNYNENILIVDDEKTLLPPVYVTHSFGIQKDWVIQDTESMVDLTFSPISLEKNTRNLIVIRTMYTSIFGKFNGVLVNNKGQKFVLRNFYGIINQNLIRL